MPPSFASCVQKNNTDATSRPRTTGEPSETKSHRSVLTTNTPPRSTKSQSAQSGQRMRHLMTSWSVTSWSVNVDTVFQPMCEQKRQEMFGTGQSEQWSTSLTKILSGFRYFNPRPIPATSGPATISTSMCEVGH